jgi:predicted  nucleic acid-binding Zn-ribbon protein
MNQNQKNQVQAQIDQYFQSDIAKLIAASYPDLDEDTAVIGEYSLKEFLSISNKVFNQFKAELEGAYFKSLPFQYQFQNEFGGGELNGDLSNFNAFITSSKFPNAVQHLNRLAHYQAVNGFWEKSKRKYFRSTEDAVNDEKERIELVSKQLDLQTSTLQGLLKEIENSKDNLVQFTGSKKKELSEIESLLTASRNHNNEISDLHSTATSLSEKITSLLNASNTKKNDTDILHKESRAELKKLQGELEAQSEAITSQNSEYGVLKKSFEDKLSVVEDKFDFFSERNQYLDDLIGREVGASLFETFKQRKGELSTSISFWKWSVPITAIATIAWIFFLFGNGDLGNLEWQVIFVNSLKALPAIGLLLFSISQYTKERNFQEEYAFKSAVALTVNAYADQLIVEENKDKLIMDSVNEIYKSPLSSKHKDAESKSLTGTAKELTEVAKSLLKSK